MAEIDERYKRGMIYTIRNIKDDTMVYVGSSINNLSKRFDNHKRCCKAGSSISLYSYIENNDWSGWYIELYEAYSCNNKKELNKREGEVIRKIGTINKCIAGRTKKEYRKNYAEKRNEEAKQYYQENSEKIAKRQNEKVCCDICGAFSTKNHLPRHQKSKKCISKIPDNTDTPSDTHI